MSASFLASAARRASDGGSPAVVAVPARMAGPHTNTTRTSDARLLAREVLFGNPENISPAISPDGARLLYAKPDANNVLNIFVRALQPQVTASARAAAPVPSFIESAFTSKVDYEKWRRERPPPPREVDARPPPDYQVTFDTTSGITAAHWLSDSKTIVWLKDNDGDSIEHLFAADVTKPAAEEKPRDLTPFEGVRCYSVAANERFPTLIKVELALRDPTSPYCDMYTLDLETGELTMDFENPGDARNMTTDRSTFEVHMYEVTNDEDQSTTTRLYDAAKGEWYDWLTIPMGRKDEGFQCYTPDRTAVYVLWRGDRDTTALVTMDAKTAEEVEVIAHDPACDLGRFEVDEDTLELEMYSWDYARRKRVWVNKEKEEHYNFLAAHGPENAEVSVISQTTDKRTWVYLYRRDDGPIEYNLYRLDAREIVPLFVSKPTLNEYKLAHMEAVTITARDGAHLVGFLTRADTEQPTPLVLVPHGGPWARDYWGYDAQHQWMANRGYAVLTVNYRGSQGYGKAFMEQGYGEWGVGVMQNDLTDAVEWACQQGIALRDKVAISGHSYGGYATLAGLCFTPGVYACGVCLSGISNIKTLLGSLPPFLSHKRKEYLKKIGDVDADPALNEKISPLFHVDAITSPLLIGHGANDPICTRKEADQIARTMDRKGIRVEYVLYPDEGHYGLERPGNWIDFHGRMESFLATHLGGRCEAFVKRSDSSAVLPLKGEEGEPHETLV